MTERLTDRPDKPGVWFRRDPTTGKVVIWTIALKCNGAWWWDEDYEWWRGGLPMCDLPAGGWSKAVPAARVAELEAENAELKRELSLANSRFDMAAGIAMDALKEGNAP